MVGRVEAIFVAAGKGEPMTAVEAVHAEAGVGLAGDRYAEGQGTFSKPSPDRNVTLIEAEALEAVARDYGIAIRPEQTRRNLVTRGAYLNHLVGRTFRIGAVQLRGVELCEPCDLMKKTTGDPRARQALLHRGGLRAELLTSGPLHPGDPLEPDA